MRLSGLLARLRLAFELSLILHREALLKLRSWRKEKIPSKSSLTASFLIQSTIFNLTGLFFAALLLMVPVEEVSVRALAVQFFIILFVVIATFSNSWTVQSFSILDPLVVMPIDDLQLGMTFIMAASISSIWPLLIIPLAIYLGYLEGGLMAGLGLGASIATSLLLATGAGMGIACIIGGRRYVGVSKKATAMRLLNTAAYVVVIYGFYYIYSTIFSLMKLISGLMSSGAMATSTGPLILIYPLNILLLKRNGALFLLTSILWFLLSAYFYRFSFKMFFNSMVSPTYVMVEEGIVEPFEAPREGLYRLLVTKDLKIIVRDVRTASLLALPFLAVSGILASSRTALNEYMVGYFLVMLNVSIPFVAAELIRTEKGGSMVLFTAGLRKRQMLFSKIVLAALLSLAFLSTAAFILAGLGWLGTRLSLKLFYTAATFILSWLSTISISTIILSKLIRDMSLEGDVPSLGIEWIIFLLVLSIVSSSISILPMYIPYLLPISIVGVSIFAFTGYMSARRL